MRVLLDLLHPAHGHVFRPFVKEMTARGHEVRLCSRHKDVLVGLLDGWGLEHRVLTRQGRGRAGLALELAGRSARLLGEIRRFRPHVAAGLMGPCLALAAPLARVPAVILYDNETTPRLNAFAARRAAIWLSPRGYRLEHGPRHRRYAGYHESAYLHPARFTPDAGPVRRAGLDPDRPYSLVRFVSWTSVHDGGESGFSAAGKREAVRRLSALGPVRISSEATLPADLEPLRLDAPVGDIHHLIAHAAIFVGESSTMASEAAILGTPAAFVSRSGRGVNDEQAERYGLVAPFHGDDAAARERAALDWIDRTIADPARAARAAEGHARLLADTIDVTGYLVALFERWFGPERYPGVGRDPDPDRDPWSGPEDPDDPKAHAGARCAS
ncbi:MAG: hypothetical protein AAFP17_09100 [Pseudomonadota bacterium]